MKKNHHLGRRASLGLVALAVTVPTMLMTSGIADAAQPANTDSATTAAAGQGSLVPSGVFGVIQDGFDLLNPVLNGLPGIPLPPLL